ncbi:MAG: hypothetical protein M1482_01755 [Chloroflexi bacterium]|nr:hypothetical protein [Chloroflexota bacterium]
MTEPLTAALLVVDALEAMGVRYLIGGSLASAAYGIARSTADADLVADLRLDQAEQFARALEPQFYLDLEAIREAIRLRTSFNVIHLSTMFKVDIFIQKPRAFDRAQMDRRVNRLVAAGPERYAYMASAEDTVLAKLEWYRLGGETSERQWQDVLAILKIQKGKLDLGYLRGAAPELHVVDLLDKVLAEAGLKGGLEITATNPPSSND